MPDFTTAHEWAAAAIRHVQDHKGTSKLMFADDPNWQLCGLHCPDCTISSASGSMFTVSLQNLKESTLGKYDPFSNMLKDYTRSQVAKRAVLDFINTYRPLVITSRFDRLLGDEL